MDTTQSFQLYDRLAASARAAKLVVPAAHNTLFTPTAATPGYCQKLYGDQVGKTPGPIPNDATCAYCRNFMLGEGRKVIDKIGDLTVSDALEPTFNKFLEQELRGRGLAVRCEKCANVDGHLPDFHILRESDGKVLKYYEFKCIFHPYIKIKNISTKINRPNVECYSDSLTLDAGKKLAEQRRRVENILGVDSTIYVYWYDLPCVKGVYWMDAKRVYQIADQQIPYERFWSTGDFAYGRKVGTTLKVYLPLLEMLDFESLVKTVIAAY